MNDMKQLPLEYLVINLHTQSVLKIDSPTVVGVFVSMWEFN